MNTLPITASDFTKIYTLIRETFPQEECYPYDFHQKAFQRDDFFGRKLVSEGEIVAFVTGFQRNDYLFLDYFAVDQKLRGQGIGSAFFRSVIEQAQTPVLLEVELPEDQLKTRRIQFYERLGFCLNTYSYKMPEIAPGFGNTPLYLMSYPHAIPDHTFPALQQDIESHIYQKRL